MSIDNVIELRYDVFEIEIEFSFVSKKAVSSVQELVHMIKVSIVLKVKQELG